MENLFRDESRESVCNITFGGGEWIDANISVDAIFGTGIRSTLCGGMDTSPQRSVVANWIAPRGGATPLWIIF